MKRWAIAMCVLGACAGRLDDTGGDDDDPGAPDAMVCEPRLVSSDPADGAMDVPATLMHVALKLDRDWQTDELTAIELRADDIPVSTNAMVATDDTTIAQVAPAAGFTPATDYALTLPCDTVTFSTAP